MPSTISRTVAMAIPIPEAEALKSKTTAKIIAHLEQREADLLAYIAAELSLEDIGSGTVQHILYESTREAGFLGT